MRARTLKMIGLSLRCCVLLVPALAWSGGGVAADESVTVRFDSDSPSHPISDRLIGVFFEDINFGADGGFCAELIKNRSFEFPNALLGWQTVGEGVLASRETEAPLSAANPTFLRLRREQGAEASGGVTNSGFRGIGVRAGESYRITFQARCTAGESSLVEARIVDSDGTLLAHASFDVAGSAWGEFSATLQPGSTASAGCLELRLADGVLVDVDAVSLCPVQTWKDRPGGLRRDLVQLLADLKPAFFRFPGGCIVEGSELKYRYQWKTTIGPRDERRLIVNRWNTEFAHRLTPDYYQSFDLGFFEYFQLAEDLGAEPLPILNCGMACQFNTGELVPLEELDPYIEDALDLIEFANGPVSSEWGARRAAMGRPEPFGMKLLGVGNEQWGPEYFERYQRFAEVLQREHPEIELISTSGPFPSGEHFDFAWPLLRKLGVPIVDEHCYATPDWFLREAHRYDNYDRGGPQAFMGEYAAQSVKLVSVRNRNNLRCALAEAAFLTGVERNSDIVTMSAYAPLMAHEDAWQWRPNLIWFDNLNSYGTPSYHVQKMFSLHRGDVSLPIEVIDERPVRPLEGRFGFGSHNSSVEFRDLSIEWSAADATEHEGDWQFGEGVIRQTSRRGSSRVLVGDPVSGDTVFTCKARKTGGREGFVVYLRYGEGGSRIEWNVGGWGNTSHGLIDQQATHATTPRELTRTPGSIEQERWYDVRIETRGARVICSLDGQVVHDLKVPAPRIDRVFATASSHNASGETIVKLVNPTRDPTPVRLDFGKLASSSECRLIRLTGDPDDENSIDRPDRVIPVESRLQLGSGEKRIELPPHSLSILRFGAGDQP